MSKKLLSIFILSLLVLGFSACSDDDDTAVLAGYTEVKFYLDCTDDSLSGTANVPQLMGFNVVGMDTIVGADTNAFDTWALSGTNNILSPVAGQTDLYVLTVFMKLASGATSGEFAFKYINRTPGYPGVWDNEQKAGDFFADPRNTWESGSVMMTNNDGSNPSDIVFKGWTPAITAITNYIGAWAAKGDPTAVIAQTVAVTVTVTNMDSFSAGTNFSDTSEDGVQNYTNYGLTGSAAWMHTDGTSTWTPAVQPIPATGYTAADGGTLTFSYTAGPVGIGIDFQFKLVNRTSGDYTSGDNFAAQLPNNAATASYAVGRTNW